MFNHAYIARLSMKNRQITSELLMVRPVAFKKNEQTSGDNHYQQDITGLSNRGSQDRALAEFDDFVNVLRANGIRVTVIQDTEDPETPDSIFPNNWISFHHDGSVALYPMLAENRRAERRPDILDLLKSEGYEVERVTDFTAFEASGKFLEGTGSMILDRENHLAYAALSERTDIEVLNEFCAEYSYEPVVFTANQLVDGERLPIYHTNVMMCLTEALAIICLESIDDLKEREKVVHYLESTGKEIIAISEKQVANFAGNMLSLHNAAGDKFLVMSESAKKSLLPEQEETINKHYKILSSPLDTIEALGGGSARCMMAEVFLPRK